MNLQFDWTISLGNIISVIVMVGAFVGGAYKFVLNHLEHLELRLKHLFDEQDQRNKTAFGSLEGDIRELRSWIIQLHEGNRN